MGIFIAAFITTALALGGFGYLLFRLTSREDRVAVLTAALVSLPLQPLAFYWIRIPLDAVLKGWLGDGTPYAIATTFYAPVTEEPAKWLVLLAPLILRRLQAQSAVPIALATGLGFGIGEIWFLAEQISRVPAYAQMPFWMFGGFLTERLVVVFLHGALVMFAFHALATGKPFVVGALIGIFLHYLLNFPIFLAAYQTFGLSLVVWQTIAGLWPLAMAAVLAAYVNRLTSGRFLDMSLGQSQCPECGTVYRKPFLALNLGPIRYERCPGCRRFHFVPVRQSAKPVGDKKPAP